MDEMDCLKCKGDRLRNESLYFKISEKNIAELSKMDLEQLSQWFNELPNNLSEKQRTIATEIIKEITTRLSFLLDVGLNYLTLNRRSEERRVGKECRSRRSQ